MAYAILRIAKHSSNGSLGGMTKHNRRELDVPNRDPQRTHLNQELIGTGDYVHDVNQVIERSGALLQKNGVKAIEHIMTASPEAFREGKIDMRQWCQANYEFLQKQYGSDSIIASMSLHLDEKTPHIHAFVVPMRKSKLKGGREVLRVGAKHFTGNREKLSRLQDNYADKMKAFGLHRGMKKSKAKHTTVKEYYSRIEHAKNQAVINHIQVPRIAEKPPLINRTQWVEDINSQLHKLTKQQVDKANELITEKAFLSVSERFKANKALNTISKYEKLIKGAENALNELKKDKQQLDSAKLQAVEQAVLNAKRNFNIQAKAFIDKRAKEMNSDLLSRVEKLQEENKNLKNKALDADRAFDNAYATALNDVNKLFRNNDIPKMIVDDGDAIMIQDIQKKKNRGFGM